MVTLKWFVLTTAWRKIKKRITREQGLEETQEEEKTRPRGRPFVLNCDNKASRDT